MEKISINEGAAFSFTRDNGRAPGVGGRAARTQLPEKQGRVFTRKKCNGRVLAGKGEE